MKKLIGLCITLSLAGFSNQSFAKAEVEINWENPKEYRDVRPANESRKRFRESTFKHIDKYMNKLAEKLPEGNKLVMTVSDLDLAGRVWPASFVGFGHSSSDIRLVKSIDIPRINFDYKLVSTTGEVLQEAEVKLKDMSFLERSNRLFSSDVLRYEKNMLKRWFNKEFQNFLVKEEPQRNA